MIFDGEDGGVDAGAADTESQDISHVDSGEVDTPFSPPQNPLIQIGENAGLSPQEKASLSKFGDDFTKLGRSYLNAEKTIRSRGDAITTDELMRQIQARSGELTERGFKFEQGERDPSQIQSQREAAENALPSVERYSEGLGRITERYGDVLDADAVNEMAEEFAELGVPEAAFDRMTEKYIGSIETVVNQMFPDFDDQEQALREYWGKDFDRNASEVAQITPYLPTEWVAALLTSKTGVLALHETATRVRQLHANATPITDEFESTGSRLELEREANELVRSSAYKRGDQLVHARVLAIEKKLNSGRY